MTPLGITDETALSAISTFISIGSTKTIVDDLQARGLVAREPRISRTLRLTLLGIEALEGELPMVPLTVEALAEIGPTQVVRHMTPRHVECSGLLQAVVES